MQKVIRMSREGNKMWLWVYIAVVLLFLVPALIIGGAIIKANRADASGSGTLGFKGRVYHYTPDDGYDNPISVTCNGNVNSDGVFYGVPGYTKSVPEGHTSDEYCADDDMDGIYIHSGEELWCLVYGIGGYRAWSKNFDGTGWHKTTDDWRRDCTLRVD